MLRKTVVASASICIGLLLVASVQAQAAEIVARSAADWNSAYTAPDWKVEQGENNWQYGYYTTEGSPETFSISSMAWDGAVPAWKLTGSTAFIHTGETAHPDVSVPAARRWTSTVTDTVLIEGDTRHVDPSGTGDGTTVRFYINGVEIPGTSIAVGSANTDIVPFSFQAPIYAGQPLDIVVEANGNMAYDLTKYHVRVHTTDLGPPEPATLSLLALGGLAVMRRRRK